MDVDQLLVEALRRRAVAGITTETLSFDENMKRQAKQQNSTKGDLTGYDCPDCLNRGTIAIVKAGYLITRECKCKAMRIALERIKSSGLELPMQECRFDNFEVTSEFQQMMKEKAEKFTQNAGEWFVVCGQSGCGKTHICTAICGKMLKAGNAVIYMNYRDDITQLKQNITDAESYQVAMNKFKRTAVLYIDDFFKGKITEADINATFELLNYRYNNRLTTIISTEMLLNNIAVVDEAIAGRIRQRADDYFIQIGFDPKKNYRMR